jgi:anti-sigma factor RsiW
VSCDPERITAYVDGALDDVRMRGTEEHLAGCPACREQAEAERALRQRLRQLATPEPGAHLPAAIRRRLRPARGRALRWALPLAAGLGAALLWLHGAAPFVAWELARDHGHCFGQARLPAQVWSGDAERVAAWLEEHGAPTPRVLESAHGLELVGARRCPLLDRRVGHVYYASEEHQLSLFVVPGWVRVDDANGLRTQTGGRTVRLLRLGGQVVGVVSEDAETADAFARSLTTTLADSR